MTQKSIFLICPVRDVSEAVARRIAVYIQILELRKYRVHWPPRDTNQNDPIGLMICEQNAAAIHLAQEIHIWYDPTSQGSLFDLGAAFLSSQIIGPPKKFVIANAEEVVATEGKSFVNVLLALAEKNS